MKNRTIKFRAWNGKVISHWTIGQLLLHPPTNIESFNNCVWMQFIGLTDKNRVEIFEGDIVKNVNEVTYKIEWSVGCYWAVSYVKGEPLVTMFEPFPVFGNTTDKEQFEVIGNIYEHPELLK